jgi:uncharacterized membrane protein
VVSLAVFLATAQPWAGVTDPPTPAWVGIGSVGAVAACLAPAARSSLAARGAWLEVAIGVLYALIAALPKPLATRITANPLCVLTACHLYALILVGLAGLLLNQSAFQSGPFAAPLTALTLVDSAVSVIAALTALRETLSIHGPRPVIEVAACTALAGGIWLASTGRQCHRR